MKYRRMPIEAESPEQFGYERIRYNLTESSVRDARSRTSASRSATSCCSTATTSATALRELRRGAERRRGGGVTADDVLVTAGAAPALFIVATSLLERATSWSWSGPTTPPTSRRRAPSARHRASSTSPSTSGYRRRLDANRARSSRHGRSTSASPARTTPPGVMMDERPPRDRRPGRERRLPSARRRDVPRDDVRRADAAAGRLAEHARRSACRALSKTYGIPGIRIGWLADPRPANSWARSSPPRSRSASAASVVDEAIASRAFAQRATWLRRSAPASPRDARRDRDWIADEELMEWVEPRGGVVCFPRIRSGRAGRRRASSTGC